MGNDLKKIKGLTFSRELNDRVGVAMFLHAQTFDLNAEETAESNLAKWAIANPMGTDPTLFALVATDPDIVANTTIVEPDVTANKGVVPANKGNTGYTPVDVSLENVTDDMITAAVEKNWSRVSQKYAPVTPSAPEVVSVTNGDGGRNPFLDEVVIPHASEPARQIREENQ